MGKKLKLTFEEKIKKNGTPGETMTKDLKNSRMSLH